MDPDLYIDHPLQIPIELEPLSPRADIQTLPPGGIRLGGQPPMTVGRCLRVRIPAVGSDAWADMRVAWQRLTHNGYELGLHFLDAEQAFKMRLMEQLCHITCYRQQVWQHEGRHLEPEQAALEWIGRFAGHFPTALSEPGHAEPISL